LSGKDEVSKVLKGVGNEASGLGKVLGQVGTIAAGFLAANVISGGVQKLTGFIGDSVAAARESIAVDAQLAAVLKSTGGAAGVTADAAKDLASSIEKASLFEDEAVLSGENLLLTFTGIGKDVFPRATQAMVDMSQALGQDMKSSAIQLGKALNDPINGITALSRVGVSFTEQQKEMITAMVEAGDVAGAQTLILDELNKEFGGSAKAASDAAGASEKYRDRMNALKEDIGAKLIPIQEKFKEVQLAVVNALASALPVIEKVARQIGSLLTPAIKAATEVLGTMQRLFSLGLGGGQVGGELSALESAMFSIGQFIREDFIPAWNDVRAAVGYFFLALKGGNAGGELTSLQKTFLDLGTAVRESWETEIKPAITAFMDIVITVVQVIKDHWNLIGPVLQFIADFLVAKIEGMIQTLHGLVEVVSGVVQFVDDVIHGRWAQAWEDLKQIAEGIIDVLIGNIKQMFGNLPDILWNAGWDAAKSLINGIKAALSGFHIDINIGGVDLGPLGSLPGFSTTIYPFSFAKGTPFVPFTGLALLHKGEAVIPANQNPFNGGGGGGDIIFNVYGSLIDGRREIERAVRDMGLAGGGRGVQFGRST
jgi:hypothetical protein